MSKILIVDDSPSMRQMIVFTLESQGHETIQACDGVDALDIIKNNNNFDVIITDINMPNMDGLTLINEIRKINIYKFIPILVLTTENGSDKKMKGRDAGATGWIVKPFSPDKLSATVHKLL